MIKARVLVLMGVSGSGKTTIASILASRLGWELKEGDELHRSSNVEKMRAGRALTDEDRREWLARVAAWIDQRLSSDQAGIITCSALKRSYRDAISRGRPGVMFVYLAGSESTIASRLARRRGHFMPARLLRSQLADLEEPAPDEPALRVDISPAPELIAGGILEHLGPGSAGQHI